jgi:hypothetical protein
VTSGWELAKKYSINIENDEVVSVEVDGVVFANAEDIPDAMDREKINELISKSNDDDNEAFDREFDRQFEKDVAEMQRDSRKFPKVIMSIFLAVAALMLVIAVYSTIQTLRRLAAEQVSQGQVVDMVDRSSYDSETRETTIYSYPVVEFTLPSGTVQRVQLSEGSSPPSYTTGESVTILYQSEQPNDARIKSSTSTLLQWILPAITGTVGFGFLAAVWVVFRVQKSSENN